MLARRRGSRLTIVGPDHRLETIPIDLLRRALVDPAAQPLVAETERLVAEIGDSRVAAPACRSRPRRGAAARAALPGRVVNPRAAERQRSAISSLVSGARRRLLLLAASHTDPLRLLDSRVVAAGARGAARPRGSGMAGGMDAGAVHADPAATGGALDPGQARDRRRIAAETAAARGCAQAAAGGNPQRRRRPAARARDRSGSRRIPRDRRRVHGAARRARTGARRRSCSPSRRRLSRVLLVVWVAFTGALATIYLRRRSGWVDRRVGLTHDLIERMVGHRTRLAQQPREQWHDGEDETLERYVHASTRMDDAAVWLLGIVPRGWMVVGARGAHACCSCREDPRPRWR